MNKTVKRIASLAVVGALVTGGLAFSAQAASADQVTGTITITPVTGNSADADFLQSMDVTGGCPVGYRVSSDTQIFQGTTRLGSVSLTRTAANPYGTNGLAGEPIHQARDIAPTNGYLSNRALNATTQGTIVNDANFELRVYCYADNNNRDYVNDKFYSLAMSIDANGVWKVGSKAVVVVPALVTSTSLTALLNSDKTATLSATVKDPSGTALPAAATGSVQFLEGSTVVGTGTIVNGVASATTTVLATGSHSFIAKFTATDPAAYAPSTSAAASVIVTAPVAPPGSTIIDVTFPTGTGVLSYAGLQSTISLGQAVLTGGLFKASGDLGPITITDTRQLLSSSWSLTGVATNFTSGTKVIDGKYLGWKPALVGTSNAGVAGAEVLPAPGSTNGLKTASPLSTGSVVDGITSTVIGAKLNLAAPGNTPGGLYTATLTLTLL